MLISPPLLAVRWRLSLYVAVIVVDFSRFKVYWISTTTMDFKAMAPIVIYRSRYISLFAWHCWLKSKYWPLFIEWRYYAYIYYFSCSHACQQPSKPVTLSHELYRQPAPRRSMAASRTMLLSFSIYHIGSLLRAAFQALAIAALRIFIFRHDAIP